MAQGCPGPVLPDLALRKLRSRERCWNRDMISRDIYIYICIIYMYVLYYIYICIIYMCIIYICIHVYVIHIYIPLYSYFLNRLCLKLYSTIWVAWWYPNHGFARQTIGWRTLERSPGNQKAHGYDIVVTHLGSQKSDSLVFRIKTVLELSTFLRCFGRYHLFLAMSK